MSKTPICDRWEYDTNQGGLVVPLNVAKDLETELAEARAEIERWKMETDEAADRAVRMCNASTGAIEALEANIKIAQAEVERLNVIADIQRVRLETRDKSIAERDKLIEQMREAISDVLRHAEPPQHDIRGCMRANCWWCQVIRVRDAALSAAERSA